jgi:hypothetical protein
MTEPHRPRVKYVIGPDGSPLTIADLPAPGTKRWVIRRKAEVVAAVRGGLLSLEEACSRYTLTVDEFLPGSFPSISMALPDCAPPASSNIANKQPPEPYHFDENRLRLRSRFFACSNFRPGLNLR